MRYHKIISISLSLIIMFTSVFTGLVYGANIAEEQKRNTVPQAEPAPAYTPSVQHDTTPNFTVNAKSAILMEPTTGKIILEHNANEALPPASVTKVMTLLLIYEAVGQGKIKWEDVVTVSEYAAKMGGSQIYLEAGEQQTVSDLTKSIAVSSANDAAVAMAEYLAGSEEGFILNMNKKAQDLGMKDTNFVNSCGLDEDGHVTSAHDIALMSKELVTKYPAVHELVSIWMDSITHKTARGKEEFGLSNTNKMLKSYQGSNGLKTGFTNQAGHCISATASRDGMELIAVIMGAPDSATRFDEARKLLDYGFANYTLSKGDPAGTDKGMVKVNKGQKDSVSIIVREEISVIMDKGNHIQLESRIDLLDSINAPVKKGDKAGEVIYLSEGKEVGRSDLVCSEDVEKAGLGHMMKILLNRWFVY